ncbi:58c387d2-c385-4138-b43d-62c84b37a988 [Sclerotinia trifoliorum]|uniref:58c387d2-c385-4138-b43d-62c84b37a988 n=1 Tax=Sclerotinia trifoliorum TaxID=28548 RepID=A0A8H2VPR5_9HELO|nr:58c387d2-c385-4138-b43d-62c84b37a988 [Sclerotinia trifoliorum]
MVVAPMNCLRLAIKLRTSRWPNPGDLGIVERGKGDKVGLNFGSVFQVGLSGLTLFPKTALSKPRRFRSSADACLSRSQDGWAL